MKKRIWPINMGLIVVAITVHNVFSSSSAATGVAGRGGQRSWGVSGQPLQVGNLFAQQNLSVGQQLRKFFGLKPNKPAISPAIRGSVKITAPVDFRRNTNMTDTEKLEIARELKEMSEKNAQTKFNELSGVELPEKITNSTLPVQQRPPLPPKPPLKPTGARLEGIKNGTSLEQKPTNNKNAPKTGFTFETALQVAESDIRVFSDKLYYGDLDDSFLILRKNIQDAINDHPEIYDRLFVGNQWGGDGIAPKKAMNVIRALSENLQNVPNYKPQPLTRMQQLFPESGSENVKLSSFFTRPDSNI